MRVLIFATTFAACFPLAHPRRQVKDFKLIWHSSLSQKNDGAGKVCTYTHQCWLIARVRKQCETTIAHVPFLGYCGGEQQYVSMLRHQARFMHVRDYTNCGGEQQYVPMLRHQAHTYTPIYRACETMCNKLGHKIWATLLGRLVYGGISVSGRYTFFFAG